MEQEAINPFDPSYIHPKTDEEIARDKYNLFCEEAKAKSLKENVLTLEEYQQLLDKHDWNYQYTDDMSVFNRGAESANRLYHLYNYNDLRSSTNDYWRLFKATMDKWK